MRLLALFLVAALPLSAQTSSESARQAAHARAVTIIRDDWGIAHVHGHTDADAVFGAIYAQCEDDFNRVETNYLVSLGRLAEAEGQDKLWQDLRQRLFLDTTDLKRSYTESPLWLQSLMLAWADGINFYLAQHPPVKPRVLTHWEPWMALSFTEGSIGGDIERVNLQQLRAFYDNRPAPNTVISTGASLIVAPNSVISTGATVSPSRSGEIPAFVSTPTPHVLQPETQIARAQSGDADPGGSNGFAIAPANTANRHALLLINPHTSFFFRSELQMSSDEGLNAYGAATWGQFFIYQGFNDRAGWMHTSSNVDAVDEFADDHLGPDAQKDGPAVTVYSYGNDASHAQTVINRAFTQTKITLRYRTAAGTLASRTIEAFYDHRGPIIRSEGGKWISIELMNKPVEALEQSFLRTKAHTYAEYRKTMALFANSSNNTIFADADGDIAYWHGDFIPKRDERFDYTHPVDGTNPGADWGALMTLDEIPHLLNPASGWLENVNNAPWSGAGKSSLKRADFPAYVERGGETSRGVHAVRVLDGHHDFTLDSLLSAAFDPYLPWFARTIPALLHAYDALPANDTRRTSLAGPIAALRAWDFRWSADSIPTTLAVYWGERVGRGFVSTAHDEDTLWEDAVARHASATVLLDTLQQAIATLTQDFGTWQMRWGDINRFQRLNDNIVANFDDGAPSVPVPFTSSTWGSLASFSARAYPNTKQRYGTSGNSFVAVVEFGPRVRARAVTAGGESGDPASPHFNDEATRYASGNFRDVYFYPDQLKGHTERTYHPGDAPGH